MPILKKLAVPLLAATFAAGLAAPAAAQAVLVPDACTSSLTPGTVTATIVSTQISVRSTPGSLAGKRLAVLIIGNGFSGSSYGDLANHLARNGFIAAIFNRTGESDSVTNLFDAVDAALAHLGIAKNDPALKIALIGHSIGGKVAIDAAQADSSQNLGYPIRAVATLAPKASTAHLDGSDVAAFLAIYGSQDEDVDAYDDDVDEAFVAYDKSGTENSTTCNTPPCQAPTPAFEKTMVFAYGADHAALIGIGIGAHSEQPQDLNYLLPADTLCITKAYLTGFLRFHLWGDAVYKGMLRGEWRPPSVGLIDTAEADGFGNPAGSPLRLFFQNSPVQHKTIHSFTGSLGTFTKTAGTELQLGTPGLIPHEPYSVRHDTDYAIVFWDADAAGQWVRFPVPSGSRDGSNYTHFSLRLGQIHGAASPHDNPPGVDQNLWVGLEDVNGFISWHQLNGIPAPDRYRVAGPIRAQSHLSTRRVPISAIHSLDLTDVRAIRLFFNFGTHGTIMVDNLEWHRD